MEPTTPPRPHRVTSSTAHGAIGDDHEGVTSTTTDFLAMPNDDAVAPSHQVTKPPQRPGDLLDTEAGDVQRPQQQQQQSSMNSSAVGKMPPPPPSQVDQDRTAADYGGVDYAEFPPNDYEEEKGVAGEDGIDDEDLILDPDLKAFQQRKHASRLYWVQACYIGIGAIFGCFARILLAQIFGEECANPGTVGWLSSGAPLCVTANGDVSQEGGVLFADLPANMLGSFLMGFFQDHTVLGLAVPMALGWLPPEHPFQRMPIFHKAFTAGFCGSLTTFSSFNSAMIVLIFGTGSNLPTQIWLALFGYIIGMETSIGSFVCGKSFARRLHRNMNPVLAAEAKAVRIKREEGVHIHWQLPDFERRYLSNLDMGDYGIEFNLGTVDSRRALDSLERWRISTENHRRVRHPLLPVLLDVEDAVLISMTPIPENALLIAKHEGWDIVSLRQWQLEKAHPHHRHFTSQSSFHGDDIRPYTSEECRWFTLPVAALCLWVFIFGLVAALVLLDDDEVEHIVTYRTMTYSLLFAPFGAMLRWHLSDRNGTLENYDWFPLGTFLANVMGSLISITMVATEFHIESRSFLGMDNFWVIGTIRAIRIGFAGCLTTVSTFVAEIHKFMIAHDDHAYPYIYMTVGTACILCTLVYGLIVFVI